MRTLRILFFKELKTYLLSPFGWVVLAFTLVMQALSLSTALKLFSSGPVSENLLFILFHSPYFWFYFLFLFPLITMRLFSEEEKSGTLEGLLTAPVKTWQVVLSKYFAAYVFYALLWLPILIHLKVFTFGISGDAVPWNAGAIQGTFAIILLMGALFTAFGCLASALTRNQIVAGIIAIALLVLQFSLGFVTSIYGQFDAATAFDYLASQQHLERFTRGLVDTRPVVYYLSFTAFTLFLTHHIVDYRRWKN